MSRSGLRDTLTKRLVPVALCSAFLVALVGALLSGAESLSVLAAVLLVLGAALALLALAILLRRLGRQLTVIDRRQRALASEVGSLAGDLRSLEARGRHERKEAAARHGETLDRAAANAGRLDELVQAVERIPVGPSWPAESWERLARRLSSGKTGIEQSVRRLVERDMNALLTLHRLAPLRGEPAATTSYSATPATLLALVDAVRALPEGTTVLEAGSGSSSVWMGLAAAGAARGVAVVALEHDPEYAEATRAAVARQGLEETVDVRLAPLAEADGAAWYDRAALHGVSRVSLLFVDGPPKSTGPDARFPAFEAAFDLLAEDARIVLDDTDRHEERACIERWSALAAERGASLTVERELDRATMLRLRKGTSAGREARGLTGQDDE